MTSALHRTVQETDLKREVSSPRSVECSLDRLGMTRVLGLITVPGTSSTIVDGLIMTRRSITVAAKKFS
jgi:hypothetical protein